MPPPCQPSSAAGLPPEASEVTRLLAKGNSKSAVEAAKLLHKKLGTPVSEALLVEAYVARARSMLEHRLSAEAEALVAMVKQRYPASAGRLNALREALTTAGAGLDELLRPLGDPAASPEARAAAESAVRTGLADLSALAHCAALAPGHPLRRGAEALQKALEAVTSGPLDDQSLALPEISRRSPLAPWKPLLRAIACYYRREDAACEAHLASIDPESAPARLVPALRAMLGRGQILRPAAIAMAASVAGDLEDLREALRDLDDAFQGGHRKTILDAIRQTCLLAQEECPEILPALRRQVAVQAMMEDLPPSAVVPALGGPPKNDARYFLMLARAMETEEGGELHACHCWEGFREAAIRENWFPARGPEVATVYLHMAQVAGQIDSDDLDDEYQSSREMVRNLAPEGVSGVEPELPHLHAQWLFEQACAMDPTVDSFQCWTDWAEKQGEPKAAETAAEAWQRTLPEDPRPLLRLMRYAEDRDALKKALGYLRRAEALDGVSAEVRRARLRLLILGAVRHLKQGKPRLALPELAELEALPQARENDRPAFVAALRYVTAFLAKDNDQTLAAGVEVQKLLGSKLAGAFALSGVSSLCGLPLGVQFRDAPGSWIDDIPRVCTMFHDLGFRFVPPEQWKPEIIQELSRNRSATPAALEKLGSVALRQDWRDVAYAVSAAGLARSGTTEARFLFLRAQIVPESQFVRREDLALAAYTLAKRSNDSELAAQALGFWRETSIAGSFGMEPTAFGKGRLRNLLERERRATSMPDDPFEDADEFDDDLADPFADGSDPFDRPLPRPRRPRRRRRPPAGTQESLF